MKRLWFICGLISLSFGCSQFADADEVPDLTKTPGVAREGLSAPRICQIKWGKDERHVTAKMKKQVFAAYGYSGNTDDHCIADSRGRRCEIDHLISRELGGADVVENLWPQAYGTTPWNAALKDKLENRLNREVCAGRLSLNNAQQALVTDWRAAYRRYYGEP